MSSDKGKRVVTVIVVFTILEIILAFFSKYSIFRIIPEMSIIGGGGAVVVIIVVFIILAKGQSKKRWRTDASDYLGNFLRNIARKMPILWRLFQYRNEGPEGELPFEFRNLGLELAILMNYMLRLHIYNLKSGVVAEVKKKVEEDQEGKEGKHGYRDIREPGKQKGDSWEYKVGARSVQDAEGIWEGDNFRIRGTTEWAYKSFELTVPDINGRISKREVKNIGWGNHRHLIFSVMNHLRATLNNTARLKNERLDRVGMITDILNKCVGSAIGNYDEHLNKTKEAEDAAMNMFYKKYVSSIKFYGLQQKRDANRWMVLDMNNINGEYIHPFKFGRINYGEDGTNYRIWEIELVENRIGKKFIVPVGDVRGRTKKVSGTYGLGRRLIEVDERGFFVDDINRILNNNLTNNPDEGPTHLRGNVYTCRKVNPVDIIDHSSFANICSDISAEWAFFIRDIKTGVYHPFSRTAADYNFWHQQRDLYYKKYHKSVREAWGKVERIDKLRRGRRTEELERLKREIEELKKIRRSPGGQFPAFDREALKDPTFVYRGKVNYYDITEGLMFQNPLKYPTLSTRGITDYIHGRLKEIERLANLKPEYIAAWKFDFVKEEKKEGSER